MYELIEHLKHKHLIWQGSQVTATSDTLPTGFSVLDQKLDGGLPSHGVVEIQSPGGVGELRLLMPHIQRTSYHRLTVLVNPPGLLCAEQLQSQGIDNQKVLLLYPSTPKQALWAAEQCLKSGACSNVLLWHQGLEVHQARRLQVASETGHCLQFLFKPQQMNLLSLPVSLSLTLMPHRRGLSVTITKRKGGWPHGSFTLDMGHLWPSLTLSQPDPVIIPFPLQKQG
ncbi:MULTISPECIES: translesion DNA synthesis-associated protein ImuA [Vibrio]|uniref:Recombinase RecA n=2 Tax=Vibrio TaxID=662 RepID=U2ZF22_VIBPR|nr:MULTISPECIES: translesion DNA synthesis-associated protein ImuA [Vibrio]NAX20890.1 translesion DNA synthesis-associated protein ImuA [Vibrio sp. V39_P1S14PM300]GAD66281.1 hypothetical protein VPR01S_03_01910 [Vibrio proteolyticus NBRC 13287]